MLMIPALILLSACSEQQSRSGTPAMTAIELQNFIKAGNYEGFNKLFTEERQNTISRDQFAAMGSLATEAAAYSHYELIKFANGEMLLVLMTQEKENGKFRVEDVVQVSEAMKELFDNH